MKKEIEVDELWPVYTFRDVRDDVYSEYIIEIPQELFDEYEAASKALNSVQAKMSGLYELCQADENKKYHELVEKRKRTKVEICEYAPESGQSCSKCNQSQLKGVYVGGEYIGCEACAKIAPPEVPLWPNLLEDSLRVRKLSQDSNGNLPFAL